MKAPILNLFIIDDNALIATGLSNHLIKRFGREINVTSFSSGKSALAQLTGNIHMVILDYVLEGENGNDILKSIKKISPDTEVIMLSANNEMEIAVRAYRNGASNYIRKGHNSWNIITSRIYNALTYPIRKLVKEFGINIYLAIFLCTFSVMGIGIFLALEYLK